MSELNESTNRINDISPMKGKSRFYDALMRAISKYPREDHPSAPLMLDLFWAVQDEFDHMMQEAKNTLDVKTYVSDVVEEFNINEQGTK